MLYYIVQTVDDYNHRVVFQQKYYSLGLAMRVGLALARFLSDCPFASVELLSFDSYGRLVDFDVLGVE